MPTLTHRVHGPDVYEGDGDINWKALATKDKATFGIIKLSEGDYIDSTATKARVDAMRKEGLIVGGYAFLRPKPGRNGATEFDIMYKKGLEIGLWQRDGQKVRDLRPVLDCEATAFDTNTVRGRWQTRVYIRDAINRCIKVTGHRPIIYTGKWFWDETINCKWSKACPLWLASYPNKPDAYEALPASWVPKAWGGKADLWQYTDHHTASGIKQPCDYNIYVGKDGSRRAFISTLTF